MQTLRLSSVTSLRLRALFLLAVGIPFAAGPSWLEGSATGPLFHMFFWVAYAFGIWSLLTLEVGVNTSLSILGLAGMLGLFTANAGSALLAVMHAFVDRAGSSALATPPLVQFAIALAVFPYGMLVASALPPSELVDSLGPDLSSQSTGRRWLIFAASVFAMTIELVLAVVPAWREEMGRGLAPRVGRGARRDTQTRDAMDSLSRIIWTVLAATLARLPVLFLEMGLGNEVSEEKSAHEHLPV